MQSTPRHYQQLQPEDRLTLASLEVRIVRLRKKLIDAGAEPGCIEAVRGQGYQLCLAMHVV